jgi:hypothetical protein
MSFWGLYCGRPVDQSGVAGDTKIQDPEPAKLNGTIKSGHVAQLGDLGWLAGFVASVGRHKEDAQASGQYQSTHRVVATTDVY